MPSKTFAHSSHFSEISIFVVSVKTYSERHRYIEGLAKLYGFKFQYVFDFDAPELGEADLARIGSSMSINCISTVLKHIECQKRLIESDRDIGLILEDDVIFLNGFVDELSEIIRQARQLPDGWLVFLGGADNAIDSRFLNVDRTTLIECPISTAEAYLVDREGCKKRLEWLTSRQITMPADHQLKYIDFSLGIPQFRSSIPLVTQGSITGKFKTTLDSSRSKHSRLYLSLRYRWNRLRRQIVPRFVDRVRKKINGIY